MSVYDCNDDSSSEVGESAKSEVTTTWAEELATSDPEPLPLPPSPRAAADRLTVVDIDGDVGGFVEQLSALAQAAEEDARREAVAEDDAVAAAAVAREINTTTTEAGLADLSKGVYTLRPATTNFVGSWPIGDPRANPEVGGLRSLRRVQWARGVRDDLRRRLPLYISDWREGFTPKSLAAISFLWFACLAPVLAFGGTMSILTNGVMGVPEVLVSRGLCGMAYAALAGQPMTFVGPTGLTLAFTTALFAYCSSMGLPFLPMYAWVGLWTSALLAVAALANLSGLIRYCTRFTEDVFNALLSFNYLSEAFRSLRHEFVFAKDMGSGLLAINSAALTAWLCQLTTNFRSKRYLSAPLREAVSDFGPPLVILSVTLASLSSWARSLGEISRLPISSTFAVGLGRPLLIDVLALPTRFRALALLPALFLATLFFLDQNITVRTVNSPENKLRKGPAYHLDLLALSLLTGATSVTGLPWMCSATVESLNHIRAMSVFKKVAKGNAARQAAEVPERVIENRLTGFGVHALILLSSLFVPLLAVVPLPVVSGVFLYLGRKVMGGNVFLQRCKKLWIDEAALDSKDEGGEKEMVALGRWSVFRFTAFQGLCLAGLWALRCNPSTALVFPSVIGVLMLIRVKLIPRLFSRRELSLLDTPIGATRV